jgi:hypothetical protein
MSGFWLEPAAGCDKSLKSELLARVARQVWSKQQEMEITRRIFRDNSNIQLDLPPQRRALSFWRSRPGNSLNRLPAS